MHIEESSNETHERSVIAQISIEALAAYKLIRSLKDKGHGSLVTYGELREAMGIDPQSHRGRGYLRTARRKALLVDEMVTTCEDNVGVRYLGPRETINHGIEEQAKVRRKVTWTLRKMATILPDKASQLKPEERLQLNVLISSLGALRLCLKPKAQNAIAAAVEKASKVLDARQTLQLFASKNGEEREK